MDQTLTLIPDAAGWRVVRPADLPLGPLLLGRPVAEVAALLPRLFSLCRTAQGMAARLCLGLPEPEGPQALAAEILRDHSLRLTVTLPPMLGLSPRAPTADPGLQLFGPARRLPDSPAAMMAWLAAGQGAAPLVAAIADAFAPHEAASTTLPLATPATALTGAVLENSAAARQSAHPLLQGIETTHGRGPLWRVLGMLADAEAAIAQRLPAPVLQDTTAHVPAARGLYSLTLARTAGLVTRIHRITPTDHATAPQGAMETALATLPQTKRHLAPLVAALHDPCMGVTVKETRDA